MAVMLVDGVCGRKVVCVPVELSSVFHRRGNMAEGGVTLGWSWCGPASARQPSCLQYRQRDDVTAVAVRHAVLRTSLAATAAPLRLRHAGPAAQLSVRSVKRPEDQVAQHYTR